MSTDKGEFAQLTKELENWGLFGQMWSVEQFQNWRLAAHNPNALPYPGGWPGQPDWLRADFAILLKLKRWWELNNKAADTTGLPNIEGA